MEYGRYIVNCAKIMQVVVANDQSLRHHFCFKGHTECQEICNMFYLKDVNNVYRLVCDEIFKL